MLVAPSLRSPPLPTLADLEAPDRTFDHVADLGVEALEVDCVALTRREGARCDGTVIGLTRRTSAAALSWAARLDPPDRPRAPGLRRAWPVGEGGVRAIIDGVQREAVVVTAGPAPGQAGEEPLRARLVSLLPLLRETLHSASHLGTARRQGEVVRAALDGAGAISLLDGTGSVRAASAAARALAPNGDRMRLAQATGRASESLAVRSALAGALAGALSDARRAPEFLLQSRRPPAAALVLCVAPAWSGDEPAALVRYADPDLLTEDLAGRIAALFGLTPVESRLAAALAGGATLAEAADGLRLAINTARGYLKLIFSKIGRNRQADLGRLLAVTAAQLARPRPAPPNREGSATLLGAE